MTKFITRMATADDIEHVACRLRSADIIELTLSVPHETPSNTVRKSTAASLWTRAACVDGRPTVLYGVALIGGLGGRCGSPWMVATDDIRVIGFQSVRQSIKEVSRMLDYFDLLCNQVHRDNAVSMKWLRWLGFVIDQTPAGNEQAFFTFWKGDLSCVTR